MNRLGNAKFRLGDGGFEIQFIPQGIKEFFTLGSIDSDGQLDTFKLNSLCLRYALCGYEHPTEEPPAHGLERENKIINGVSVELWSEAWYAAMPTSIIEGIHDHIFAHNSFNEEGLEGLNFT